jgi:two-component system phosphate regulon sensor histidine kinase PhoR
VAAATDWQARLLAMRGPLFGALMLSAVPLGFLVAADVVPGPVALGLLVVALAGLVVVALLRDRAPSVPVPATGPAAPPRPMEPARDGALVEALVESFPDPVVVLDEEQRVLFANSAAMKTLSGLRIGASIAFGLRVPDLLDALRSATTSRQLSRVEFTDRGTVDRFLETIICTVDPPGRAPGAGPLVLMVLRDVSQQRRVERMRADFVANASHELRTPLASLSGFIETLQGPARNDAVAREKFLGIMRVQANRMARLIDDLLSLSRIELNAHVRPRDSVDVATIVGHVVDTLQPLAVDRGVTVAIERMAPTALVTGDRDELIRLFENLVENALKYGASGKAVEIAIREGHDRARDRPVIEVAVRDHGPGIAAEHLPRLTERFYRVDVGQSREAGGTGLGLAIVKHILNRHDGELQVESRVGAGSTFTVRLPAGA